MKHGRKANGAMTVRFIIDFYDAWLREDTANHVAAALKMTPYQLTYWFRTHPELNEVKKVAEERRQKKNTLAGYIYDRLSKEAREAWDLMQFWKEADGGYEKVDLLLGRKSKKIRQELFIHGLVHTGFDMNEACRMTGISKRTLLLWKQEDLQFRQMVEEIHWHKKNFFERALINLVEERHPSAVMFVNRTVNADRGYTEKIQVEHQGTINAGFELDDLDLDIETKRKLLKAIREREARKKVEEEGETVEAEMVIKALHNGE